MTTITMRVRARGPAQAAVAAADLKAQADRLDVEVVEISFSPPLEEATPVALRLERIPGESEEEFSQRVAQVQRDQHAAARSAERADDPLTKFRRIW